MISLEVKLLTVQDVAELLQVSPDIVYSWLRTGILKGYRLGPTLRVWRISHDQLQSFVDKR